MHILIEDLLFSMYFGETISQQPENCENRNDPDLVQAFLKKWWVESDFKVPNLPPPPSKCDTLTLYPK
jgi:hypothetical protein